MDYKSKTIWTRIFGLGTIFLIVLTGYRIYLKYHPPYSTATDKLTEIKFQKMNDSTATVDLKQGKEKAVLPLRDTFAIRELVFEKDNEQGWGADIRLSFTASALTSKGEVYKVNSTYKNKKIGFEITVPAHGFSKLTIKSTGINSNNFVHVLSKLYKQKIDAASRFTDLITADCMNMGDYIDSLNKQANSNYIGTKSQYKLFFQGKNEDDYAELYLNVNRTEHWIELEEKDAEYRPIIIRLLTKR